MPLLDNTAYTEANVILPIDPEGEMIGAQYEPRLQPLTLTSLEAKKIASPKKTHGKSRFNPEGNILKMPSLSQGILDDLLPNQEASKGLNLEESLL